MIFILGITQRSGTNYLSDLLRLHANCTFERTIPEDFLTSVTPLLNNTFKYLESKWATDWDPHHTVIKEMKSQVGLGMAKSLSDAGANTVLKSPSIEGIEYFTEYFPNSKALIVIRDGRDVAVSHERTWKNVSMKDAAKNWLKQSRQLRRFLASTHFNSDIHKVVSYEKVFNEPETELKRIGEFLKLDLDGFDWDGLVHLRIRGSSQSVDLDGRVRWEPKDLEDFSPVGRYKTLTDRQQRRLNRLLKEELRYWGYEVS